MDFKKLKPFVTYFPVVILVWGVLKQYFYFKGFNLPIKYFMSWSEILISAYDDIGFLILLYVTPIVLSILFLYNTVGAWNYSEYQIKKTYSFKKRLISFEYLSFIITSIAYLTVYFFKKQSYITNVMLVIIALSSGINLLIQEVMIKYETLTAEKIPIIYINTLRIIIVSTLTLITTTLWEVINVRAGRYKGTTIETKDNKSYTSTDSSYFIGKTEKYIFIHNSKDSTNIILPTESVTRMILKER